MKCAYSAGILDRFLDENITFDYCIGVSAGSANAASYLAGQRDRNLRFYTEHIHEKGYFGFGSFVKTGDLFGLRYIYATLTNSDGADFLDYPKILENPTEYEVVATNALTAQPEYFDGKKMQQDNYLEIMASCALPAACRPVKINGIPYYDGGTVDAIPVARAIEKGCDRIVVLLSKPRDFVKEPEGMKAVYTLLCARYPAIVRALNQRHVMYSAQQQELFRLEREGKVFLFAPSRHLPMSTYAMNADENQALYDLGVRDFDARLGELERFLRILK